MGSKVGGVASGAADSLFEKKDIGAAVGGRLKDLTDKVLKVRSQALQDITEMVKAAHKNIVPNSAAELVAVLGKHSLADTNKNLVCLALELIVLLIESVGSAADKFMRTLLPAVLINIGDNKKSVQDRTIAVLTSFEAALGMDKLLPIVAEPLEKEKSPDGRR